jgi:pimeloyl-ACP methyl ester carboxylesterase
MRDRVFRKTERGVAALAARAASLTPRARLALILVNGSDTFAALEGKIGPDAGAFVETLLGLGFIEAPPAPVAAPRRWATAAAPAAGAPQRPEAAPAPPPPPPATPPGDAAVAQAVRARLAPLKRAAFERLEPHFGPDVEVVCAPLLAASTQEAWRAALAVIETRLAIYLGRRGAHQLLDPLRI